MADGDTVMMELAFSDADDESYAPPSSLPTTDSGDVSLNYMSSQSQPHDNDSDTHTIGISVSLSGINTFFSFLSVG